MKTVMINSYLNNQYYDALGEERSFISVCSFKIMRNRYCVGILIIDLL